MLKLNNKLENVYKQGRYTFAFAHYQVSFGNLRGIIGGVAGVSPAEGVADKQQSGKKRPCLQGRFVERLAWKRGGDFPHHHLYDKNPPAKNLLKKSNACYTNIVFS